MTKISYCLIIALVLLPLYSVLCQEDAWQSVLSQAKQSAGISQDTLDMAKQAMGGDSPQKVAEEALGDADGSSLADWVQEIDDDANGNPAQPLANLPDDEEEDNLVEAPENSPTEAPELAPKKAPKSSSTIFGAAPQHAPSKAPTSSPTKTP